MASRRAVSTRERLISATCWAGGLLFVISLAYYLYAYLVRFAALAPGSRAAPAALADLALFTAFALHHSVFARTGVKAWIARTLPAALERSAYTWVSSTLFLLVCTLWRPVPGALYALDGWAAAAGYLLQIAGLLMITRGAAAIDVLDLAGIRQVRDARRGIARQHTPLETRGVYGLVRHPLYLGWAMFVFGAPDMTATRFAFAAISTGYLALAIPLEERGLVAAFGDEYRAYRTRVRWRMLPGLY